MYYVFLYSVSSVFFMCLVGQFVISLFRSVVMYFSVSFISYFVIYVLRRSVFLYVWMYVGCSFGIVCVRSSCSCSVRSFVRAFCPPFVRSCCLSSVL